MLRLNWVAAALVTVMCLLLAPATHADLLLDNFDVDDSGRLDQATSTANNAGWASDRWVSGSNSLTSTSGLSFANAAYTSTDSGAALQASNSSRAGGRKLGGFWTGTVWIGYLVNLYTGDGTNTEVGLREGSGTGNESWPGYGTPVDGVPYLWNSTDSVYEAGEADLNVGQTYLALVRYQLDAGGSSLTAWHFAEGDAIPTDEAALDALNANKLTRSGMNFLTTGSANYIAYHGNALRVDAVRLSNEAGDTGLSQILTAVPEPASLMLLALGATCLLRRQQAT